METDSQGETDQASSVAPELPSQPWKLWKAFWLLCLPLAVCYQLLWDWYFHIAPSEIWTSGSYNLIFAIKLASEVLIYVAMLWFLNRRTQARYLVSKVAVASLLLLIIGVTARAFWAQSQLL